MAEIHVRRRAALRAYLREKFFDALIVTDLLNIRYLTGFTGSNAALLIEAEDEYADVFCTDARYTEQAARQVPDLETVIDRASAVAMAKRAGKPIGTTIVGFESHVLPVDLFDQFQHVVGDGELTRAPNTVERLRMTKDDTEIEALRMACAVADRALADLVEHGGIAAGRTEREVARDLERRMVDLGASGPAFESIVAAGSNSAIPHHRPTDAVLRHGDFVKLDFGAVIDGYHSDMTRMVVIGEPADWQRDLYDLVATAQAAGVAALKPGADVRDVDAAAREVIERAGRGEQFVHGLGHGVGLEIHEAPTLAKTGEGTLSACMAVTVEPGVYLPGEGGVRIEDTLVVRDEGPELLTLTSKQLMVV